MQKIIFKHVLYKVFFCCFLFFLIYITYSFLGKGGSNLFCLSSICSICSFFSSTLQSTELKAIKSQRNYQDTVRIKTEEASVRELQNRLAQI